MLKLHRINNSFYVFDVNDWLELRKNHRIIGVFIGNTNYQHHLPIKLLPEEFLYLQHKQLAQIVETQPQQFDEQAFKQFENELIEQQKIIFKDRRRRQLGEMLDEIVEGKIQTNSSSKSKDEIFEEELEKSCAISKQTMIWPILTTTDAPETETATIVIEEKNKIKFEVFKDLLQRNYYVTHGHKFGGDFLVYKNDPLVYHAIFIVRIWDNKNATIHPSELIAFGRLGTSVRKRTVLAYCENNQIKYITIKWHE